jgi:hypothetical protein
MTLPKCGRSKGPFPPYTATAFNRDHIPKWVNVFAMAVNEENAAGGRIVNEATLVFSCSPAFVALLFFALLACMSGSILHRSTPPFSSHLDGRSGRIRRIVSREGQGEMRKCLD